ncbi:MAG: DUF6093 family protein, partial [Mycetocola sp.]
MSATSALMRGRRANEKLMIDRCVIHAETDGTVINEETGEYEKVRTRVYPPAASDDPDGPCLFEFAETVAKQTDAAGQVVIETGAELSLPMLTSLDVEENHVVTMTASALDPALVGVLLRIEGPFHQTYAT